MSLASLTFVTSMFVVALFELFEDTLGSFWVLAISLFSYCKNASGLISSVPNPPTGVALQIMVLSYTQSFLGCP